MTHLVNGTVAVVAFGGCLVLMWVAVAAGSGPGTVAATVTFGLFAYMALAHTVNVRNVKAQIAARRGLALPPQPVIEAAPVRLAPPPLPERPQLAAGVIDLYRLLDWADRAMGIDAHRMLVLVVEKHPNPWQGEIIHELNAARRVVKGELAS